MAVNSKKRKLVLNKNQLIVIFFDKNKIVDLLISPEQEKKEVREGN